MSDLKITVTNWGQIALDKRELKALMRAAGNDIKNKTARLIAATEGGGRFYHYRKKPGTYHASTPGNPPVLASGDLRSSLKVYPYPSGEGFAVRARAKYATSLEAGAYGGTRGSGKRREHRKLAPSVRMARALARGETRVLEARPFLSRVMDEQAAELDRRVRAAMTSALKWRGTK